MNEQEIVDNTKITALREAIMEEFDAANTYTRLIELLPEYKEILTEILNDEINHQGRLIDVLFQIAPQDQATCFNKGIHQEEND